MRLLTCGQDGHLEFTPDMVGRDPIPPYATLSHTWGEEEVTYHDVINDAFRHKRGYTKILFTAERAKADNLKYFWVDTCCIDKTSSAELSTSINSMFKWYKNSAKCYVYLSDVSNTNPAPADVDFTSSRWFTRGWTLQELLAPPSVEFYTHDSVLLGDRTLLARRISATTGIPLVVLNGEPLSNLELEERMRWASGRQTKLEEDEAYSLFGILDVTLPVLYGEGRAKAFRRLRSSIREIQAELRSAKDLRNVHWLVPKVGSTLFTGRTDLVHRIQSAIYVDGGIRSTKQRRFVITGMGGQGKSEICIQVAGMMREDFWGIFWVDLCNLSTARNGFLAIAKALGSSADTLEESLQILAAAEHRWLLVLDNADDPTIDYAAYFPSGDRGAILMTSRNPVCQQYGTVGTEALEGLDLTHSAQLLLRTAQVQESSWPSYTVTAQDIARLLGSHTLALIQAGAYISAGYCRIERYAEKYRQQHAQLLVHHPIQQQSRYSNVYATFEASVEVLEQAKDGSGRDALDLLGILSMLHSSVLPLQVFHDAWISAKSASQRQVHESMPRRAHRLRNLWTSITQKERPGLRQESFEDLSQQHVSQLPGFMNMNLPYWNDQRLKRARALLVSLSIVSLHQEDGIDGLSMHPLAHTWAKDRLDVQHQQHAWISTGCVISLSRGISNLWTMKQVCLQPHLQTLIPSNPLMLFSYGPQEMMLPIVISCARLLDASGEHRKLQDLLESLYRVLDIKPETPTEPLLPVWRLAALAAISRRQNTLAISLLEFITTVDQNTLEEMDPLRLAYRYHLSRAYNRSGQYEKAIPTLERTAFLYKNLNVNLHPSCLLSTQYELNLAYIAVGKSDMAVALLKDVVGHHDSANDQINIHQKLHSQHALAAAYIAHGQTADAVSLLEEVVKTHTAITDELHPDRLGAQYELARAYASNNQSTKALELAQRLVAIEENAFDQTNHMLLASQYFLANQHLAAGQFDEAVALQKHVVKMYDALLEETQSERLSAKYALALAYVETREAEKALVLMRHVVEVRRRTLGSDHPHRRASEKFLGSLEAGTVFD
ncbi:hypothetical protein HBI84_132660 [Parastagonospora nodorum]|nr:hypothetical protein HBI84_132660 [Parastagonospora nodorum]